MNRTQELIKQIEISTHKSYTDRVIYEYTPEAKIKKQIKTLKENNRYLYLEGLVKLEEFERVAEDLHRLEAILMYAKDTGKRINNIDVSKLIYGSYIL